MKRFTLLIIISIITTIFISGCLGGPVKSPDQQTTQTILTTTIAALVTTATTLQTHTPPTPTIEPFPTALKLKQPFNFSSGKTASYVEIGLNSQDSAIWKLV